MFTNLRFAWTVALVAGIVAVVFAVRAERFRSQAELAQRTLAAQEDLRALAAPLQPARFVRADATTIYYRTPRQAEVEGQTFVDYVDASAKYGDALEIFGAVGGGPVREMLDAIPEGADISVDTTEDADGFLTVTRLYVAP